MHDNIKRDRHKFINVEELSAIYMLKQMGDLQLYLTAEIIMASQNTSSSYQPIDAPIFAANLRREAEFYVKMAIKQVDYSSLRIKFDSKISMTSYRTKAMNYLQPWLNHMAKLYHNNANATFQPSDAALRPIRHGVEIAIRDVHLNSSYREAHRQWFSCSRAEDPAVVCHWQDCPGIGPKLDDPREASRLNERCRGEIFTIFHYHQSTDANKIVKDKGAGDVIKVKDKVRLVYFPNRGPPQQVFSALNKGRFGAGARSPQMYLEFDVGPIESHGKAGGEFVVCEVRDWFGKLKQAGDVVYERDDIRLCDVTTKTSARHYIKQSELRGIVFRI